jgi:hypothetical protein
MNRIAFTVEEYEAAWVWRGIVPIVDEISLCDRIDEYETAHGFDLPGSYAGIEVNSTDRREWIRYLLGDSNPEDGEATDGTTWLLGCGCSVAGCWPLEARITVGVDTVTWDRFRQPHLPERNYAGFGPFVFSREEYEQAIDSLLAVLSAGGQK